MVRTLGSQNDPRKHQWAFLRRGGNEKSGREGVATMLLHCHPLNPIPHNSLRSLGLSDLLTNMKRPIQQMARSAYL